MTTTEYDDVEVVRIVVEFKSGVTFEMMNPACCTIEMEMPGVTPGARQVELRASSNCFVQVKV